MPGKLNLYNLGKLGVNVDKSPVHLEDGELTKSQNATRDALGVDGGLRKRPGLSRLNSVANSSFAGVTNLPFPYSKTTTFYAAISATAEGGSSPSTIWRTSTNGTTWAAEIVQPNRAQHIDRTGMGTVANDPHFADNKAIISFKDKLYYAGDDYIRYPTASHTAPTIHCWDGTVDAVVARAPYNIATGASTNAQSILAMAAHRNLIYVSTFDGGSTPTLNGRVFSFDPVIGDVLTTGPTAAVGATEFDGEIPYCLVSFLNRLWVGTHNTLAAGDSHVSFFRTGVDTAWTVDATFSNYNVHSLCVYNGQLYAGLGPNGGGAIKVKVRATDGTWSDSDSTGAGTYSHYTALTVFGTNLYALLYDDSAAAANRLKIRKFDGSSWSTVNTITSASRTQHLPGMGLSVGGALYFTAAEGDGSAAVDANSDGIILRSTNGTAWTEVDQITNLRGLIGYIKT